MMVALAMKHEVDPFTEIMDKIGRLDGVEVLHNQVLIATYVRPEKTQSGIILTDNYRKEDEHQGKVGAVLKIGPLAFVDDERVTFAGRSVRIGDWVLHRFSAGFALEVNGVPCRMLEDTHIKAILASPDTVR